MPAEVLPGEVRGFLGGQTNVSQDHADFAAVHVPGLGCLPRTIPDIQDEVKQRIETGEQIRRDVQVFDIGFKRVQVIATPGVDGIGMGYAGIVATFGCQEPPALGHVPRTIGAGDNVLPKLIQVRARPRESGGHADDCNTLRDRHRLLQNDSNFRACRSIVETALPETGYGKLDTGNWTRETNYFAFGVS